MNISRDYDSWREILSWNRKHLREEIKCRLNSHVHISAGDRFWHSASPLAAALTTVGSEPNYGICQIRMPYIWRLFKQLFQQQPES